MAPALVVSLAVLAAGLSYQAIGTARDRRRHPPPGWLVDVGGHRLHVQVAGAGRPTVVFDSALGGSCLSWALVQPAVAGLATTCTYDRAGLGWSESGPLPRTAGRCAEELRELLARAPVPGPYVLVGHSFGGLVARVFASRHRELVAGLVLVDAPHAREWLHLTGERARRLRWGGRLARYGAWLARLGVARLVAALASRGAVGAARSSVTVASLGLLRTEQDRIIAPIHRVPAPLRPMLRSMWMQPKFFRALAAHIEAMPETSAEVDASGPFGDLPLVLISSSRPTAARLADQAEVAALSTQSRHLIAAESGHWVPLDEPSIVIEGIREVLKLASRG
jgi:pimeloyl-ACP methyl ester carboxylesterase